MTADKSGAASARLLTYDDVARLCQVSKRTVQRWVEDGELLPMRLGLQTIRFSEAEVRRFLAARQDDVTL